jgi:hypothetical protein
MRVRVRRILTTMQEYEVEMETFDASVAVELTRPRAFLPTEATTRITYEVIDEKGATWQVNRQ